MKIVVSCDVHYDVLSDKMLQNLVAEVSDVPSLDTFILGGDVGDCPSTIRRVLDATKLIGKSRAYIPGNHDLYAIRNISGNRDLAPRISTDDLRRHILPQLSSDHDFLFESGRIDKDGVSVIVTPACHDMSFRMPWWPEEWTSEAIQDHYWRDFSDGLWIDVDPRIMAKEQMEKFMANLEGLPVGTRALLVVTHWPIFGELYSPYIPRGLDHIRDNETWVRSLAKMSDAFFTSPAFSRALKGFMSGREIDTMVISGHTHMGKKGRLTKNIYAHISDADYRMPTWILCEYSGNEWVIDEHRVREDRS